MRMTLIERQEIREEAVKDKDGRFFSTTIPSAPN